jgi:uncharacterized protein YabE (DUF348 family)
MKMRKMRGNLSLLVLGFLLVSLIFAVAVKQYSLNAAATDSESSSELQESADGTHFISIFDEGIKNNFRSDATTVREALLRANVSLDDGDKVEPALDEPVASEDFNINIYRAKNLIVLDGNHRIHVKTASTNPEDIVADADVELLDKDVVELVPYDGLLESGATVAYKVFRAKVVQLNYYGQMLKLRTQTETIADFLNEQNIDSNSEKNWVSLPLTTSITDGISFSIQPQGKQTITVEETVNYKETVTQDYDLEYGKRQVTKAGQNGKKTVTYEVDMKDGVEKSRKKLSEIITEQPVTQEVKVGMKISLPSGSHEDWMAAAGISSSDYGYVNYIISHESGWRTNASNGRYFGLYQTSKANLVRDCGNNWVNNPVCQLRSATNYAKSRYGSWSGAYARWRKQGWW